MGAGESGLSTRAGKRRRIDPTSPALLGLPVSWLALFFLFPIVYLALYSVNVLSLPGSVPGFSLSTWHAFFHGGVYLSLFWKSVEMSLIVSALVVLVAYPLAYFLALSGTPRKYVLLLLLIAPFMTSYLLRVLAWKVILGDQGVVNTFLYWTGIRQAGHPLAFLLYSRFCVMLVLGYVWLPFVALPIFVTLETLDVRLLEAASDLGASRMQAFRRVTLPLSTPGIVAAFLFVFIPTVGEFVTPALVGGTSGYMYGNAVNDSFTAGFPDWQTGATLALSLLAAVSLLAVVSLLVVAFVRFLRVGDVRSA